MTLTPIQYLTHVILPAAGMAVFLVAVNGWGIALGG